MHISEKIIVVLNKITPEMYGTIVRKRACGNQKDYHDMILRYKVGDEV